MSNLKVKFKDLEYFITLIECGSFQNAALKSNTSQPTITHAIHRIENELGVKLFSRTTRKINLTNQGENVLTQARIIVSHIKKIKETTCQSHQVELNFNIGAPILFSEFLQEKLQTLTSKINYDNIVLHEYIGCELKKNLDSNIFSCALVCGDEISNLYDKELIFEDNYLVAINKSDPLADLPILKIDDIKDRRIFVLHDAKIHLQSTIKLLKKDFNFSFSEKSLYSFNYLKKTILLENGLALISNITSKSKEDKDLVFLPIDFHLPFRNIYLVFGKPRKDKNEHVELTQELKELFKK